MRNRKRLPNGSLFANRVILTILFYLLEVSVLDVVILWSTLLLSLLLTSEGIVPRTSLSTLGTLIHLLCGSLPSGV